MKYCLLVSDVIYIKFCIKLCIVQCSEMQKFSCKENSRSNYLFRFIVKSGCSCVLRRLSFAKQEGYQEYPNIHIFPISNTFISRAIIRTN